MGVPVYPTYRRKKDEMKCEICQEREANHFCGIVCTDCFDFLRERDPCFWPIYAQWHDYHCDDLSIKAHWLRTMRYAWRDYDARKKQGKRPKEGPKGDAGVQKGKTPLWIEARAKSNKPRSGHCNRDVGGEKEPEGKA